LLRPGAIMDLGDTPRTTVTAGDVSMMRAQVGLPGDGFLQGLDVNEIWGIDIHDFNAVIMSQNVPVLQTAFPLPTP